MMRYIFVYWSVKNNFFFILKQNKINLQHTVHSLNFFRNAKVLHRAIVVVGFLGNCLVIARGNVSVILFNTSLFGDVCERWFTFFMKLKKKNTPFPKDETTNISNKNSQAYNSLYVLLNSKSDTDTKAQWAMHNGWTIFSFYVEFNIKTNQYAVKLNASMFYHDNDSQTIHNSMSYCLELTSEWLNVYRNHTHIHTHMKSALFIMVSRIAKSIMSKKIKSNLNWMKVCY